MSRLEGLLDELRRLVDGLDAPALSGNAARRAVEVFVAIEKVAAAGKTVALARLDETGAWTTGGNHRDIQSWLAEESGVAVGAAQAVTETARRLRDLPETVGALRSGYLSPAQAEVIARAAAEDPRSESLLLEQAEIAGFRGLKIECDRVRAAARRDDAERDEKNHRERRLVHCPRGDGTGRIEIHGPLDRTAQIMAALEPYERAIFGDNRRSGRAEHPNAVAFDAMLMLCTEQPVPTSGTRGRRPLATVVVHVSSTALIRGHTESGEICEIQGAGPVSIGSARRLMSDCFLEIVEREGVDVRRVARLGRTIPAHLRTAVEVSGRTCAIAGCEVERHLEIDHNVPVAAGGLTTLENLGPLCRHHHDDKTRHDLRRLGPSGRQRLVTRDEFVRERGPAP